MDSRNQKVKRNLLKKSLVSLTLGLIVCMSLFMSACTGNNIVTFYVGNEVHASVDLSKGEMSLPAVPERTNYNFKGWYSDINLTVGFDDAGDILAQLSTDKKVYAKLTADILFITDGETSETKTAVYGKSFTLPADPDIYDYGFDGWFVDAGFTTPFNASAADVMTNFASAPFKVYAKLTPLTEYVDVVFKTAGGSVIETQRVAKGSNVTFPGAFVDDILGNINATDYLIEWDYEGSSENLQADFEATAAYFKYYTVTYKSLGETVGTEKLAETKPLTAFTGSLVNSGYKFVEWLYDNLSAVDFSTDVMPSDNITLIASWIPETDWVQVKINAQAQNSFTDDYGAKVKLDALVTDGEKTGVTYQWYYKASSGGTFTAISGETDGTLELGTMNVSESGIYSVTATAGGDSDSAEVTITIRKAELRVSYEFKAGKNTVVYGDALPADVTEIFDITYTGFIEGEDESVLNESELRFSGYDKDERVTTHSLGVLGFAATYNYSFNYDAAKTLGVTEKYIDLSALELVGQVNGYNAAAHSYDEAGIPQLWLRASSGYEYGTIAIAYFDAQNNAVNASNVKNAREYTVRITFTPAPNFYKFDNVNASATVVKETTLTITPEQLEIEIEDKETYYGEELVALTYNITSGQVYEGDDLGIVLTKAVDDYDGTDAGIYNILYSYATNDNYVITFTGGVYTIHSYTPSLEKDGENDILPLIGEAFMGQTLSEVGITPVRVIDINGNPVSGQFSWIVGEYVIDVETVTKEIIFTPTDTRNYNIFSFEVTFSAEWLTVTFYDSNTGVDVPGEPIRVSYNGRLDTSEIIPQAKRGYTAEWNLSSFIVDGTEITDITDSIEVYSTQTANTYNITYVYGNGSQNGSGAFTFDGSSVTIPNPTRQGYAFVSWSVSGGDVSEGETLTFSSGSNSCSLPSTSYASHITLTANWDAVQNTYIAEYYYENLDAAGEFTKDSTENKSGLSDSTVTVSTLLISRNGYEFGYAYLNDGTTDVASFTIGADGETVIKIYYTRVEYNVTFDANEGTPTGESSGTLLYGAAISTLTYSATRTGYDFAGWSYSDDNDADKIVTAVGYSAASEVTLYAVWTAQEYNIVYNGLTGATHTAPSKHTYSESTEILNPVKAGYTFDGWYVGEGTAQLLVPAQGKIVLGGTEYTADITLTAKWSINSYTVTFTSENGAIYVDESPANGSDEYQFGSTVTLTTTAAAGYKFERWTITINGETTYSQSVGYGLTIPAYNVTVSAEFTLNTNVSYTVKILKENLSGGYDEVTLQTTSVPFGTIKQVSEFKQTFTGFDYKHAYLNDVSVDITQFEVDESGNTLVKLYYDRVIFNITFNANGGTLTGDLADDNIAELKFGAAVSTALFTATRTGYTLDGWYIGDTEITTVGYIESSTEYTLTAKWSLVPVAVTVTTDAAGNTVVFGTSLTLTANATHALKDDGDYTLSYQWYKGAAMLDGKTLATLVLTEVAETGSYKCVVTLESSIGAHTATTHSEPVTATVSKADIADSGFSFAGAAVTFDGTAKTLTAVTPVVSGVSFTVGYSVAGQGAATAFINSGTYNYTATFTLTNHVNYNDFTKTLTATLTISQRTLNVTITGETGKTYNGENVEISDFTVETDAVAGYVVTPNLVFKASNDVTSATIKNAGTYTFDDTGSYTNYVVEIAPFTYTIAKKSLTVTVGNATRLTGENNPSSVTLTPAGLVGAETLQIVLGAFVFSFIDGDGNPVTSATAHGSYRIVLTNNTAANYEVTIANEGTLTINRRAYTGANPTAAQIIAGIAGYSSVYDSSKTLADFSIGATVLSGLTGYNESTAFIGWTADASTALNLNQKFSVVFNVDPFLYNDVTLADHVTLITSQAVYSGAVPTELSNVALSGVALTPALTLEDLQARAEAAVKELLSSTTARVIWVDGEIVIISQSHTDGVFTFSAYYLPSGNYKVEAGTTLTFTITINTIAAEAEIVGNSGDTMSAVTLTDAVSNLVALGAVNITIGGEVFAVTDTALITYAYEDVSYAGIGGSYKITFTMESNRFYTASTTIIYVKVQTVLLNSTGDYYTIEDALKTAASGNVLIVKFNTQFATDNLKETFGYIGEQYYTVKAGVTLLLPAEKTGSNAASTSNQLTTTAVNTTPIIVNTLYIEGGITLNVSGNLLVNGLRSQTGTRYMGFTNQGSAIKLGASDKIIVKNGGSLTSVGFVYGDGEVLTESGATVTDVLFIQNFKGGSNSTGLWRASVFPFEQYTMQNIEVKLSIVYGAKLRGLSALYVLNNFTFSELSMAAIEGDAANPFIGMVSPDSAIIKKYDVSTGRVSFDMTGELTLNTITMEAGVSVDTSGSIFPLSGNMDFVMDGDVTFKANVAVKMMPNATFEFKEGSTVTFNQNSALYAYEGNVLTYSPEERYYAISNDYYRDRSMGAKTNISTKDRSSMLTFGDGCYITVGTSATFAAKVYLKNPATDNITFNFQGKNSGSVLEYAGTDLSQIGALLGNVTKTNKYIMATQFINRDGVSFITPDDGDTGIFSIQANGKWNVNRTVTYNLNFESQENHVESFLYSETGFTLASSRVNVSNGVKTGDTVIFADGEVTIEGYQFGGWFTDKGTQNPFVADPEGYPPSSTTLYAKWTPYSYEVKLYYDSTKEDLLEVLQVPYGTAIVFPEVTPNDDDYYFVGWCNIADDLAFDRLMPAQNLELYVDWGYVGDIQVNITITGGVIDNGGTMVNREDAILSLSGVQSIEESPNFIVEYNKMFSPEGGKRFLQTDEDGSFYLKNYEMFTDEQCTIPLNKSIAVFALASDENEFTIYVQVIEEIDITYKYCSTTPSGTSESIFNQISVVTHRRDANAISLKTGGASDELEYVWFTNFLAVSAPTNAGIIDSDDNYKYYLSRNNVGKTNLTLYGDLYYVMDSLPSSEQLATNPHFDTSKSQKLVLRNIDLADERLAPSLYVSSKPTVGDEGTRGGYLSRPVSNFSAAQSAKAPLLTFAASYSGQSLTNLIIDKSCYGIVPQTAVISSELGINYNGIQFRDFYQGMFNGHNGLLMVVFDGTDNFVLNEYMFSNPFSITATNTKRLHYVDCTANDTGRFTDKGMLLKADAVRYRHQAIFELNGGTMNWQTDIIEGTATTISLAGFVPTREGFTFVGWCSDESLGTKITTASPGSLGLRLFAKWQPNANTLGFNSNGGSPVAPIDYSVNPSASLVAPVSVKEGYVLEGWYSDKALTQKYTFTAVPTAGTELFAKWEIASGYIVFDTCGGDPLVPLQANSINSLSELPVPERAACNFNGWFMDAEYLIPATTELINASLDAGLTLYVRWEAQAGKVVVDYGKGFGVPYYDAPGYNFVLPAVRRDYTQSGSYYYDYDNNGAKVVLVDNQITSEMAEKGIFVYVQYV